MSSQQFSLKVLAAALLATSVSAHMTMSSPVPYGLSTLNNSPLAADGSDYPCKQRTGVYDLEGASNTLAVGGTYPLTFVGTAVHGGGSCQVSLTTDQAPTVDSKWMVIKSIEGGCPADVPGNLDVGGASTPDPYTFSYTIPEGIAPGDYTIAWSWINKVGNREFYMNCGPATITAATKKRYAPNAPTSKKRQTATFPDIFIANLGAVSGTCGTVENFDYAYPDPGANVEKLANGTFSTTEQFTGDCGGTAAAAASSPSASAAASGASTAAGSSATGFATGTAPVSSSPAAATETVSPVPVAPSSPASVAPSSPPSVASAAPSVPSSSSTTTGAVVAGAACTPEGEWACAADGNSYQRCASGVWSVSMQMAAGTTCTPGVSDTLTENVTPAKRQSFHERRSHRAYERRN